MKSYNSRSSTHIAAIWYSMVVISSASLCAAFIPLHNDRPLASLLQKKSPSSVPPLSILSMAETAPAEFEFQEMRINLQEMQRQRVPSKALKPGKRAELESYVRRVVQERPSAIPLAEIGNYLPGTRWQLIFSTEGAALADLPQDATVFLDFDEKDLHVDYMLQFSKKTMGLNRLVAKSTYTFDIGPVNPGLVTFVYNEIKTDVFGFSDLPVGFFGLLKGRANYVESNFFDGQIWIERAFGPDGSEYYNVYLKEAQP